MTILDVLSWCALVAGGGFAILAGIGLLRLPDFFSRVHAAGILDTLALALILGGLLLQAEHWTVAVKLVLLLALVLITGPTATHALARAALHAGFRAPVDKEDTSSNN